MKRRRKTVGEGKTPAKNKKLKPCQKAAGDDTDRISRLPDELLHHILALLGTNHALRTRLLSKRWNSLWTSLPALDFGERSVGPTSFKTKTKTKTQAVTRATLLINFIHTILNARQHNSPLVKFSLYLHQHFDSSCLSSWLPHLITLRIQHLHLAFHRTCRPRFAFPSSFFTCDSLTFFKLVMPCQLNFPASVISLPSLKILHLLNVSLPDGAERLFSGCPVLEKLILFHCKWLNVNTVKISALKLHTLHLYKPNGDVQFFAPNVTNLIFSGILPHKDIFLSNMPSLAHAHIAPDIDNKDLKNVGLQQRAINFLQPLSHVPVLTIHKAIGEALFNHGNFLPTLDNVTSLTLKWDCALLYNQTLINILYGVPNLENLHLHNMVCELNALHHFNAVPTPLKCFLHLKCVEIYITNGPTELHIIQFFLTNARILEEMVVTFRHAVPHPVRNSISKKLAKIPVCSQKCRIVFR